MAKRVKALAANPDKPSLNLGSHMIEGQNWFPHCPLASTMCVCVCVEGRKRADGGQRRVFFSFTPGLVPLRQCLSLKHISFEPGWLSSFSLPWLSLDTVQGYRCVQSCLSLHAEAGNLNSASQACTVSSFIHGAVSPVPAGSSSSYIAQVSLMLMILLPQSLGALGLQECVTVPGIC